MSLLCSYENIITHFITFSEVVNLSSNNMHFLIMTVWKGLMGEKLAKKYISNKGECLSPWFLGTRITSALLLTVCCACRLWRPPRITLLLRKSLLGIPHGRSRWTWMCAQTYKERRRKRNNNKLNHVWTTTASRSVESLQWTRS